MTQKEDLLDKITELYQIAEDIRTSPDVSPETKFAGAALSEAVASAFARVHKYLCTLPPGIPVASDQEEDTQIITLSLLQLATISNNATAQGKFDDLVHIVSDRHCTAAYYIHPHLPATGREIFTGKPITSPNKP